MRSFHRLCSIGENSGSTSSDNHLLFSLGWKDLQTLWSQKASRDILPGHKSAVVVESHKSNDLEAHTQVKEAAITALQGLEVLDEADIMAEGAVTTEYIPYTEGDEGVIRPRLSSSLAKKLSKAFRNDKNTIPRRAMHVFSRDVGCISSFETNCDNNDLFTILQQTDAVAAIESVNTSHLVSHVISDPDIRNSDGLDSAQLSSTLEANRSSLPRNPILRTPFVGSKALIPLTTTIRHSIRSLVESF